MSSVNTIPPYLLKLDARAKDKISKESVPRRDAVAYRNKSMQRLRKYEPNYKIASIPPAANCRDDGASTELPRGGEWLFLLGSRNCR